MHRPRIAVEDFGDAGEIDRAVAAFDLARRDEALDEAAQAKAIQIEIARGRHRRPRVVLSAFSMTFTSVSFGV